MASASTASASTGWADGAMLDCSVGVMAYNEEGNIADALRSMLSQEMSGARITGKAAQLLKREGAKYALSTQCIGGGQGIATILEAVEG